MKATFTLILMLLAISCTPNLTKEEEEVVAVWSSFTNSLKYGQIDSLQKTTTDKGVASLLRWSDSTRFSKDLIAYHKPFAAQDSYEIKIEGNSATILLGEYDVIVGHTTFFLIKDQGKWKIDEYRPGK